jgi:hypothetical protein
MLRDFREREREGGGGGGVCNQKSKTGAQCVQTKSVGVVVGAFVWRAKGHLDRLWCRAGMVQKGGVGFGSHASMAFLSDRALPPPSLSLGYGNHGIQEGSALFHQHTRLDRECRVFQLGGSGGVTACPQQSGQARLVLAPQAHTCSM